MYINLRGGMYDVFKARGYTNWIRIIPLQRAHTFQRCRTNVLTATFPSPNPATWNLLDLGIQRKDTGGYFEWQRTSPWYFRVDGNQVKQSGAQVGSSSNGTSPGNGFVDLAFPVQYETNNVSFEGGYATSAMTLSANYLISNFGNDNSVLFWNNPFYGNNVDRQFPASLQRLPAPVAQRRLPAVAVELDAGAALHVGQDDERLDDLRHRAERLRRRRLSALCCRARRRSTATRSGRPSPPAGRPPGDQCRHARVLQLAADEERQHEGHVLPEQCRLVRRAVRERALGTTRSRTPASTRIGASAAATASAPASTTTISRRTGPDFDDTSTNTYWIEWKNTQLDNVVARIKYSYIHRARTSCAATPERARTTPFTWSDSSIRSTSRTSTRTG
jgi:hypothetical protein